MNVSAVNNVNVPSQVNLNDHPSDLTPAQIAAINAEGARMAADNYMMEHATLPIERELAAEDKATILANLPSFVNSIGVSKGDAAAVIAYIQLHQDDQPIPGQ